MRGKSLTVTAPTGTGRRLALMASAVAVLLLLSGCHYYHGYNGYGGPGYGKFRGHGGYHGYSGYRAPGYKHGRFRYGH